MQYYVYQSDSKINMLFDQIDEALVENIADRLTIDLKFLKINPSSKKNTQIEKLKIITEYLKNSKKIGNNFQKDNWILKTVQMNWGPIGDPENSDLVFFTGSVDDCIIGLGGSWKHVLGQQYKSGMNCSITPTIIFELRERLDLPPVPREEGTHLSERFCDPLVLTLYASKHSWGHPSERLTFLAQTLHRGPFPKEERPYFSENAEKYVWLGTPLWVTLEDL